MPEEALSGVMALNFEIRREKHAIGEFIARMQFAKDVGAPTFAKIVSVLKEVAADLDLPAPLNVQSFVFAIGNPAGPPPSPMGGSGFQRFSSNGEVACSLVCDPNSIAFTLREYDRWMATLPVIAETFSRIGREYLAEVPAIRLFSVQYINEFRAVSPETSNTAELFRAQSKWIAPFSYESGEPWHCHVGQFIPSDGDHRYLVNVNCDISPNTLPGEDQARYYARVLILAARHYDIPGNGPLIVDVESLRSVIEENFNDTHSLEKRMLGEIISDEYLAIMGEGANEH